MILCLLMYVSFFGLSCLVVFFFKKKTAYDMRISDWSSDVGSSDLVLDSGVDSAHRPGVDGRGGLALPYLPYRRLCDLAGAVYLLRRVSLALLHLSHRQLGDLAGAGRLLRLRGGGHG